MSEKSEKRWFQFKISTWMVLVAIGAWLMTCSRPWWVTNLGSDNPLSLLWTEPDAYVSFNPELRWPALVLVAFLGWKAGWFIHDRGQGFTWRSIVSRSSSLAGATGFQLMLAAAIVAILLILLLMPAVD